MPHEDALLKKPELARKLGISLGKVNDLLRRKQLTPVRIGRCVRFAPGEVDRFVAVFSVMTCGKVWCILENMEDQADTTPIIYESSGDWHNLDRRVPDVAGKPRAIIEYIRPDNTIDYREYRHTDAPGHIDFSRPAFLIVKPRR